MASRSKADASRINISTWHQIGAEPGGGERQVPLVKFIVVRNQDRIYESITGSVTDICLHDAIGADEGQCLSTADPSAGRALKKNGIFATLVVLDDVSVVA